MKFVKFLRTPFLTDHHWWLLLYFINIPIKIISKNQEYESFDSSEGDPVTSIIKKYQNHPSIKLSKTKNNLKLLDLGKLILMRSKSLSKN